MSITTEQIKSICSVFCNDEHYEFGGEGSGGVDTEEQGSGYYSGIITSAIGSGMSSAMDSGIMNNITENHNITHMLYNCHNCTLPGNFSDFSNFSIDDLCVNLCNPDNTSTEFILQHHLPQILLAFLGIILNFAEIYIMKKKRKCYPSEYLLVSLAISDLSFSIFACTIMVMSIFNSKKEFLNNVFLLGEITENVLQFSILASIFHVLAISLERLYAVSAPLRHRVLASERTMRIVVFIIWFVTLIFAGSVSGYQYHEGMKDSDHKNYKKAGKVVGGFMYMSAFFLAIIYSILTRKLIMQTKFLREIRKTQRQRRNGSKIETIAFLAAFLVTAVFIICTVPFATLYFLNIEENVNAETVCQCLLICNSILNPTVYFWRGYWLKTRRRKPSCVSAVTNISRKQSKEELSQISITTLTRNVNTRIGILPNRNRSASYDLSESPVDIFDYDAIPRFRQFDASVMRNRYNDSP